MHCPGCHLLLVCLCAFSDTPGCSQGRAHLLLEAYKAAEAAFLDGLGIDPSDQALATGLKLVHQAISEAEKAEAKTHKR